MADGLTPGDRDVLLVIDVQNDFCPGGALAVPGGGEVVPAINRVGAAFPHLLMIQDWHPAGHESFASSHTGRSPFETIDVAYGAQTLWPDHCVQGSEGAAFHVGLALPRCELVIRKGFRRKIDSYSAFFENDQSTTTGLAGYLRDRGITRVFSAGLAADFCVGFTAVDAARQGFTSIVIEDACRAIDLEGSLAAARSAMAAAGVELIQSDQIAG